MNIQSNYIRCPVEKCSHAARGDNLRRHLALVHHYTDEKIAEAKKNMKAMKRVEGSGSIWPCPAEDCPVSCGSKSGILSHINSKHPSEKITLKLNLKQEEKERDKLEVVGPCTKKYENKKDPTRLICALDSCTQKVSTREELCDHLRKDHKYDGRFEIETKEFDSKESFETWLNRRKEATCTSLAKSGQASDSNITTIYYKCTYEGSYASTATKNRKKVSKKQTGDKCCPAFLKVTHMPDNSYLASGCFDHEGHDLLDWAKQKYTDGQLLVIRRLIEDSLTNDQIITRLRKDYSENNRLHFIMNDDIRVIRERFELYEGRLDKDDLKSVKKRSDQNDEQDGIRFFRLPYNNSGQGFVLVMILPAQLEAIRKFSKKGVVMDETFNVTRYDLKLTTLLVLDENDRGLPVGYLLSNCTSTEELRFFFRELKKLYPEFCPSVFMTDEAGAFWNAYVYTFPQNQSVTKKLWCRWHVSCALKKKALECLKKEQIPTVVGTLYKIIRTPSEFNMQNLINQLMSYLSRVDSDGSRKYAQYFKSRYIKNVRLWCTAYRDNSPVQTSMMAESWHSKLKRETLHNKLQIRVDSLLHTLKEAVLKLIGNRKVERARGVSRGNPRGEKNRGQHKLAVECIDDFFLETSQDPNCLFVVDKTDESEVYVVENARKCECGEYNSHCEECGVCWSDVTCSCVDQVSGQNCIHCHIAMILNPKFFSKNSIELAENAIELAENAIELGTSDNNEIEELVLDNVRGNDGMNDVDVELVPMEEDDRLADVMLSNLTSIKNAYTTIESEMRKLSRTPNNENCKISCEIVDAFDQIVKMLKSSNGDRSNEPGLLDRPDIGASKKVPLKAAVIMHLEQKKKNRKRKIDETVFDTMETNREEFITCSVCLQVDAPSTSSGTPSSSLDMKCSFCSSKAHQSCVSRASSDDCTVCATGYFY